MLGPLILLVCAFLWGTAFVAQKHSAECLGPFTVLFVRGTLAAAFLFVWSRLVRGRGYTREVWIGGGLIGLMLFLAMLAQQIGIASTTAGISSFLTSNYILIVPILGMCIGRPTRPIVWLGVALALAGSYLICIDPAARGFAIGRGEAWTILCAFLFAVQILFIDHYAPKTDVIALSCAAQIAIVVLTVPFLFLESEKALSLKILSAPAANLDALMALLYLGIVSSGIAYTLQNLGQARTPPTLATIVMSLESVFGAISGHLWFGDTLTVRQLVGCALVFLAATMTPILLSCQRSRRANAKDVTAASL